jgi:hypothetical protein
LLDPPPFDGELRTQLVAFRRNFGHGNGQALFKAALRQAQRATPDRREEHQRQEPCEQKSQRKDHKLFDHARSNGLVRFQRRAAELASENATKKH